MIEHLRHPDFGIMPTILGIPAYTLFVGFGIIAGIVYYLADAKTRDRKTEGVIEIVSAALIFGVIGSKLPILIQGGELASILYGKSILGGFIGGMAGVYTMKRIKHIKTKMGNVIAPAAALGMAIGRLGCFFNGCCAGIPASWGLDFGDGILRYPTQLFETGFHLTAFVLLHSLKHKAVRPGILFKYYVLAYFVFRFFIEFIRVNPRDYYGLTLYQLISLLGIVFVSLNLVLILKKPKEVVVNGD